MPSVYFVDCRRIQPAASFSSSSVHLFQISKTTGFVFTSTGRRSSSYVVTSWTGRQRFSTFDISCSLLSSPSKPMQQFTTTCTSTTRNTNVRGFPFRLQGTSSVPSERTDSAAAIVKDDSDKLKGCVCLVTGASRGIGKGIAIELGKLGATVYITGTTSDKNSRPKNGSTAPTVRGTIEGTASDIIEAGGVGIPIECDHSNDQQVQAVFDRIAHEQNGQLHILVNNCFQTPYNRIGWLMKPFWEQGPSGWDPIHTVGLRSHYVATCYAMPLMFQTSCQDNVNVANPMVFMISSFGGMSYTFNVPYGVGKAGLDRMVKDMSIELNDIGNKNITVLSMWPGVVRTEMNDIYIQNGEWDKHVKIPITNDELYETPNFTGKAIIALILDQTNIKKSGTIQVVAEVAEEYNLYDLSNTRPPSIRSLKFLLPTYGGQQLRESIPLDWIPDWKLPIWLMAGGKPPTAS